MKQRVLAELTRIEHEADIRVLLAVESGSRAWGFASPDSDYDVRFIYVHPRDWYVAVVEARDVIAEMLPGDLDLGGWELRKTLRLFAKCNLALNEWLDSPIVYRERPGFAAQLRQLLPRYFNPIAATHHYRSMAEGAFKDHYADGRIRIKKLFYVLRPLLACRWIEQTGTQPPTAFATLAAAQWVSGEEQAWVATLLQMKAPAAEGEVVELAAARADAIAAELEHHRQAASALAAPLRHGAAELDPLLRAWIEERH